MTLKLFTPRPEPEPEPDKNLPQDDDWVVISTYTRAEALADGALVDVSDEARKARWKFPVAITQALRTRLEPNDLEKAYGQSYAGRLWDVLWMAVVAAVRSKDTSLIEYGLYIAEQQPGTKRLKQNLVHLWAMIGPGDEAEPVVTIGFPSDF